MGFLDWMFRRPRCQRIEDSYAMTRDRLWPSLKRAVEQELQDGHSVWLVAHFANTFTRVQEMLAGWQMEYNIADRVITSDQGPEFIRQETSPVMLILADLLKPSGDVVDRRVENVPPVSIIVVERHPLYSHDQRLESFARSFPGPTRFGYLLAIDDPVIRAVVTDTMIEILQQLGMREHELITSNMISRRLNKVLAREELLYPSDQRADSVEEWYSLNRP